jgi:hypothetical protein
MDVWQKLTNQAGILDLSWQNAVMFLVGGLLIFLAVRKNYEPLLLIPIGFGAIPSPCGERVFARGVSFGLRSPPKARIGSQQQRVSWSFRTGKAEKTTFQPGKNG